MYIYSVPDSEKDIAAQLGLTKTKTGKWVKKFYDTSGSRANAEKQAADRTFGQGKWWNKS